MQQVHPHISKDSKSGSSRSVESSASSSLAALQLDWRDDHGVLSLGAAADRGNFSRTTLRRGMQEWGKRRVPPSTPACDDVVVTHCCWVPSNPPSSSSSSSSLSTTASPPAHVLCALSNGTLCFMNTMNYSKSFLLEDDVMEAGGGATTTATMTTASRLGGAGRSSHSSSSSGAVVATTKPSPPPPPPHLLLVLALDTASPPAWVTTARGRMKGDTPAATTTPPPPAGSSTATAHLRHHRGAVGGEGKTTTSSTSSAAELPPSFIWISLVQADGVFTGEVDARNRSAHKLFRKASSLHKVIDLPPSKATAASTATTTAAPPPPPRGEYTTQFTEDRQRVLVVAPCVRERACVHRHQDSTTTSTSSSIITAYQLCVLCHVSCGNNEENNDKNKNSGSETTRSLDPRYVVEHPWRLLPFPAGHEEDGEEEGEWTMPKPLVVRWWGGGGGGEAAQDVLVVWSNGEVQLLRPGPLSSSHHHHRNHHNNHKDNGNRSSRVGEEAEEAVRLVAQTRLLRGSPARGTSRRLTRAVAMPVISKSSPLGTLADYLWSPTYYTSSSTSVLPAAAVGGGMRRSGEEEDRKGIVAVVCGDNVVQVYTLQLRTALPITTKRSSSSSTNSGTTTTAAAVEVGVKRVRDEETGDDAEEKGKACKHLKEGDYRQEEQDEKEKQQHTTTNNNNKAQEEEEEDESRLHGGSDHTNYYYLEAKALPRGFCTQDMPISDIQLFVSFSPCLAVVLHSGALLLLDVWSMELHNNCKVGRVKETPVVAAPGGGGGGMLDAMGGRRAAVGHSRSWGPPPPFPTGPGGGGAPQLSYQHQQQQAEEERRRKKRMMWLRQWVPLHPRCVVMGKPLAMCVVDKHTVSFPERMSSSSNNI